MLCCTFIDIYFIGIFRKSLRNAARICFPTFWERAKSVVSQFLYWILFPFDFRYYYSQCRSIDSWDIVIINIDPTNCIWWKSKVTSYGAEFHNYAKSFTLWSLCRNWCVISRLISFYDKVNLCPIELNSTTKWNLLHVGFFVEIYVYHHDKLWF